MRLYNKAPKEITQRLQRLIVATHERLAKHKVTIDVRMVMEDVEMPMPCLKHQGYSAIAIVSVTPLKRRAQGAADALIEIDQVVWDELGEAEQDAVLDHELTHLEPQLKESGEVKRDGAGRPKLRIRLHDHQYGWFHDVAMRHGAASQEVQQYSRLYEERHQTWFAFAGERAEAGAKKRKPSKAAKRFKAQVDELIGDVEKQTGVKFQRDVTIQVGGRKAAQR